ncbi:MAG: outer membrane protein assembly factor [Phyllobacteriaceae bacterium]|nr:outer membrane protein assembly factor [Phyllobacteriaceae bacterium]
MPVRETTLLARGLGAAGLSLACLFAAMPSAHAFDLFGIHLFGERTPPDDLSPDAQPYTVELTATDSELEKPLRAASALVSDASGRPPPSTAAFLARARGDYAGLLAGLRDLGRWGPVIAIEADGRRVETIPPDATLPHPVAVTIRVDPGPRFTFGRVAITNRPPLDADALADPRLATPERAGLGESETARADAVLAAERALVDGWKRLGHPEAKATERRLVAHHDTNTLDVEIGVDPGPAATFGAVRVSGTELMDPEFVAARAGIPTGERWDPAKVKAAEKRLRDLDVFASSRLVEDDAVAADGSLGLNAALAERPLHVFGFGASYSTLDGAGVEGWWQHRNLFGHGDRLRFEGRVSGIDTVNPRDLTWKGGVSFLRPGVFTPMTDLMIALEGSREVVDPYTEEKIAGRIGLAHEFFPELKGKVAVNLEADKVEDGFGKRDLTVLSLPSELALDRADDKLEPTTGYRLKGAAEPFHEFRLGSSGAIFRLDASAYYPLDADRRFVVAGRAAIASIVGADADRMPADRLFFAGGGASVRGFAYRSLGPTNAAGKVVGGLSLVEASLELRMKVTDSFGVVPFVDMGAAGAKSTPDFDEAPRFGAGVGLRYYTGLGAIRVDLATPISPKRGDPKFGLYIGLGESF